MTNSSCKYLAEMFEFEPSVVGPKFEIHPTGYWTVCLRCRRTVPKRAARTFNERVGTKIKRVTRCPQCGGILWVKEHSNVSI